MEKSAARLIALINYGIHDVSGKKETIEKMIEGDGAEEILDLAVPNGLASLVAFVFENNQVENEAFHQFREQVIGHHLLIETEEKELREFCQKEGLKFAFLKGMQYRSFYPGFATREMGNIDILIEPKERRRFGAFMKQRDFYLPGDDANYHDCYLRGILYVEAHYALIKHGPSPAWKKFAEDVNKRFSENAENGKEAQLSAEDAYIFLVAHAYKQRIQRGIGIRYLVDIFLFRRAFPESVDTRYVKETMNEMKVADFEKRSAELSDILFSNCPGEETLSDKELLSKEQEELFLEFLNAGANGGNNRKGQIFEDPEDLKDKGWINILREAGRELDTRPEWYSFLSPFAYKHERARPAFLVLLAAKRFLESPISLVRTYGAIRRR